jgi:hypothetical protein
MTERTTKGTTMKITITKQDGSQGILTRDNDGKYSITLNGKHAPGSMHYTQDQVDSIVAKANLAGSKIEITE